MDHGISDAISTFIAKDPPPAIQQFLDQDAPHFRWITALAETLAGQVLFVHTNHATGVTQLVSQDGDSLLEIISPSPGRWVVKGILGADLRALLSAIRIHEVESYDLVMLPPDIREADVRILCDKMGITSEQLHRFINLWISQK